MSLQLLTLTAYLVIVGLAMMMIITEMEKRADSADISVLFFSYSCANFLAVYAQRNYKHCGV